MEIENYRVQYKEFVIISAPLELVEKQGWIPRAIIRIERDNAVKEKELKFEEIFLTKEEANQYAFGMAQKYIDNGDANNLLLA